MPRLLHPDNCTLTSGVVCIDDITLHYVQEGLPFGGFGASGMGANHGPESLET